MCVLTIITSFHFSHLTEIASPEKKTTCFQADFYYFGLSSLHSKVQVSELRNVFPFDKFTDLSKGMADMIKKEMKELRLAKVGGNEEFKPKGQFVLGGAYIYHHWKSAHAACSKETATHLAAFGVSFEIKQEKLLNCRNDDHLVLDRALLQMQ